MKTIKQVLIYLQLTAMLTSIALAAAAPSHNGIPFRGSFAGTEIQEDEPTGFFSVLTASGTASLLGRFTLILELHVTGDLSSAVATVEFIAANGESLFGGVQGVATLIASSTLSLAANVTITEGTRRFAR